LSQAQRSAILELNAKGVSKHEIARVLKLSRLTIRKVLQSNSSQVPPLSRPEKAEPYRQRATTMPISSMGTGVSGCMGSCCSRFSPRWFPVFVLLSSKKMVDRHNKYRCNASNVNAVDPERIPSHIPDRRGYRSSDQAKRCAAAATESRSVKHQDDNHGNGGSQGASKEHGVKNLRNEDSKGDRDETHGNCCQSRKPQRLCLCCILIHKRQVDVFQQKSCASQCSRR